MRSEGVRDLGLKGKRAARPSSVLHRFAAPDEVAALIVHVFSAKASATTGAALRVAGGGMRAIP